ncbi:MAG TPA: hypothetical protein EYH45_04985 [Candidatus Caldiarchaeum subterraneum]|uniref:Copper resistance protein D domain-containing protein n=1 Tax=Caldiarchaeum subterraneum TaxID=311458 RepID=A0A832ZWR9_CALS0|nr:hypothetical protein [Candidatus Caldarchaeum subterraneum]
MLSLVLHWIHLLSVVLWIGGVGYILFVLLGNMRFISLRDRARFVPRILKRFLVIVWLSIAAIIISGLYRVIFVMHITSVEQLIFTRYGNILGLKIILVVALITVALRITTKVYNRTVHHVAKHVDDEPNSYTCAECGSIVGSIRNHLEVGFLLSVVIIFLAAMLRGA